MLSAIIATNESERRLVPTLSALFPGMTGGVLREVIIVDGGSRDATQEVAEVAGCRFIGVPGPVGRRLREAARQARGPWLLFLRAGTAPEPAWVGVAGQFIETMQTTGERTAAAFRTQRLGERPSAMREFARLLFSLATGGPSPDQGLLIAKAHYEALGGHGETEDAENALLERIGRRKIALLSAAAAPPR